MRLKLCILISKTNSCNEWFIALAAPESLLETDQIQKANLSRKSDPLGNGAWPLVFLKVPVDCSTHPGLNH